jgi:hypothetical protein
VETRSDPSTWLERSQGFRVESGGGRIGIVEDLRYDTRSGIPDFLIVRAGRLGRRRMLISVDDIREILPSQKRIRLQATWMTIKT